MPSSDLSNTSHTRLVEQVAAHPLLQERAPLLLAMSGGVDSVVLAHLCFTLKIPFGIAHAHFGLRGEEADADAALAHRYAATYQVPYYEQRFNPHEKASSGASIQMICRELRYDWFRTLLQAGRWTYVVTAHHADDNVETVLLHWLRGAGLAGLQGIPPQQGPFIRPLLEVPKAVLLAYARHAALQWREDASNQALYYRRNVIRHEIVPHLRRLNPNLAHTVARNCRRIRQVDAWFAAHVQTLRAQIRYEGPLWYIDTTSLTEKSWAPAILHALLEVTGVTFEQVEQLWEGATQGGRRVLTATHAVVHDRSQWVVGPYPTPTVPLQMVAYDVPVVLPGGTLTAILSDLPERFDFGASVEALIDESKLHRPLTVRRWCAGDAFVPLGMKNRKKISDFLVDAKVDVLQKQYTYVVLHGEEIVWLVGHRLDERYKVEAAATNRTVVLRFVKSS